MKRVIYILGQKFGEPLREFGELLMFEDFRGGHGHELGGKRKGLGGSLKFLSHGVVISWFCCVLGVTGYRVN